MKTVVLIMKLCCKHDRTRSQNIAMTS